MASSIRRQAARLRERAKAHRERADAVARELERKAGILEAAADQLGLEGWPRPIKTLVARSTMRHTGRVTDQERRRAQADAGRSRRKKTTPVHEAMDAMGWNLGRLAEELSKALGRPVSRASVQFWAVGEREITDAKGRRVIAVLAPEDARRAAEKLTKGALKSADWPNARTAS